eukprot:3409305-Amphidinium_carterae.1
MVPYYPQHKDRTKCIHAFPPSFCASPPPPELSNFAKGVSGSRGSMGVTAPKPIRVEGQTTDTPAKETHALEPPASRPRLPMTQQ